jgi:hypothetical protein
MTGPPQPIIPIPKRMISVMASGGCDYNLHESHDLLQDRLLVQHQIIICTEGLCICGKYEFMSFYMWVMMGIMTQRQIFLATNALHWSSITSDTSHALWKSLIQGLG